jgi:hypothetical protein
MWRFGLESGAPGVRDRDNQRGTAPGLVEDPILIEVFARHWQDPEPDA